MGPDKLARSGTEHGHQVALFAWANKASRYGFEYADNPAAYEKKGLLDLKEKLPVNPVPELEWFHAIPNGGARGNDVKTATIRGGQLKAEGVKAGVLDTFLPVARKGFHGLYIEMKKPGKLANTSKEQDSFAAFAMKQGYHVVICDCWKSAVFELKSYLKV